MFTHLTVKSTFERLPFAKAVGCGRESELPNETASPLQCFHSACDTYVYTYIYMCTQKDNSDHSRGFDPDVVVLFVVLIDKQY